jgi:hypothetical protein
MLKFAFPRHDENHKETVLPAPDHPALDFFKHFLRRTFNRDRCELYSIGERHGRNATNASSQRDEQVIEYDSHGHTRDDISAVLDVGNHRITRIVVFSQMPYARCAMDNLGNNIQTLLSLMLHLATKADRFGLHDAISHAQRISLLSVVATHSQVRSIIRVRRNRRFRL